MMENFEDDIKQAVNILNHGGLILYPTDTIWGIGCDATNSEAVAKIYQLKKRTDEKTMIILLADEKDIKHFVTQLNSEVFDFLNTIKNPTTIIYNGGINVADNLINFDGTIAIRIVKDNFCKQLIKRFKKPIVSTSANVSGHTSPTNFNNIGAEIKNGVDFIVQHRQNDVTSTTQSSIIKWNNDGTKIILR